MTRRRWGLLALAVAGVGWILGGEWVSIHHGVPENHFLAGGSSRVTGGTRVLAEIPCDT